MSTSSSFGVVEYDVEAERKRVRNVVRETRARFDTQRTFMFVKLLGWVPRASGVA
jgi:hypothetical protein